MSEKTIIAVAGATGAQGGGLVRALLPDREGPFSARAIARNPDSEKVRALGKPGVEVVARDTDDHRAWTGLSPRLTAPPRHQVLGALLSGAQAMAMARATRKAGVQHVIWSTLEDTRKWVPLDDPRLPTLQGKYKVPHFDGKGCGRSPVRRGSSADHVPSRLALLRELHLLRHGAAQRSR